MTQKAKENFAIITKVSLNQFLEDKINERFKSAMQPETTKQPEAPLTETTPPQPIEPLDGIVTTEEEWEGYYFVKAILHDVVDPSRIIMRDARSYCAILLDNNRKPICRFYFDAEQKYVSVFDNEERKEKKIPITDLNELFKMADRFKKVVAMYDKK